MTLSRRFARAVVIAAGLISIARPAAAQKIQTNAGLAECPAGDSVTPIQPPTTPLPPESATAGITRFSFVAYGDTRGRHDGTRIQPDHELIAESILGLANRQANTPDPIKFIIQSGDGVQNGRAAQQWNVSYSPIINMLSAGGLPYFLSVGNHDVSGAQDLDDVGRIQGLCHYFNANARLIPPEGSPRRLTGYPTYAFGYGNSFFIAFDSNIPDDTVQANWVERQLAGLDRRRYVNVVAFYHHPAFSSGPHGGPVIERQALAIRNRYMPMLRKYHVRLLVTGHEHLFEHWVERYQDSTGSHRIDQIVSGGGGAPIYTYTGEPNLRDYRAANAGARVAVQHLVRPGMKPGDNPYHYVIVHVNGDQISVDVVGIDWGAGFSPYPSASATLTDRRPPH
jgi:hypothetical protein